MFDIRQRVCDEYGELDLDRVEDYRTGLMEEFALSPEAAPLDSGELGWVDAMMDYAFNYHGKSAADMSLSVFNDVLFKVFPRKVSTEPESAAEIISGLRAFWLFVHRQYGLPNAQKILPTLDDDAVRRLKNKLADPSQFGMAKSLVMLGHAAGYDMTNQDGLNRFLLDYNASPMNYAPPIDAWDGGSGDWLPAPATSYGLTHEEKRKVRKRQRQARKRNRKR